MQSAQTPLYRYGFGSDELGTIGDFSESRLELRVRGELRRGVQPLPLKVLGYLLRHQNRFVDRDRLLHEVWPAPGIEQRAVYNAIAKLREALGGRDDGGRLIENGRGGYRFRGTVTHRVAETPVRTSEVDVVAGAELPWRAGFRFERRLESSPGTEVWLASNRDTGERRVCKFAGDDEHLVDLRREVALALLLRDQLGGRECFVALTQWDFERTPSFVESAYGGPNLYAWADEGARLQGLALAARVEIAAAMVEAVHAAHGVGVVHMDLKPSNVLVAAKDDGGWQVRVVDFGSGRSLDRAAIDRLEVQRLGLSVTQVVEGRPGGGTADYLAPEIRGGAEVVIPVLCDVFALGVMTYQLLAGDLRKPLAPGWERDIDDPFLREDIALATDGNPHNRLQSASGLHQRLVDLEGRRAERAQAQARAAHDDAQRAQAQLDRERRRQLEARRPWVIATLAVLVVGLAAAVWQWRDAQAARARAEASAAQAQAVTRFLNEDVLGLADPYRAQAPMPAIREALQRAVMSADRVFAGQPRTEAAVRLTLAGLLDRYDDPRESEAQWRAAVALLTQLDGAYAPDTLRARYRAGVVISRAGKFDEAEAWLRHADEDAARAGVDDAPTAAQASHAWGLVHLTRQRLELAAPPFERALVRARAMPRPDDDLLDSIRHGLSTAYSGLGRFDDSARVARELVASLEARPVVGELRLAAARYDLGQALLYQGDLAAAQPLLDAAARVVTERLGAGSASAVMIQTTRCELLVRRDQKERALDCAVELHRVHRTSATSPRWMAWFTLANVGVLRAELRRLDEALPSLEQALRGLIDERGPDSARQFVSFNLAQARWRAGQTAAALPLLDGLDPAALQSIEPDVPWAQRLALLRGLILSATGREEEARSLLGAAIDQLTGVASGTAEPLLEEAKAVWARGR